VSAGGRTDEGRTDGQRQNYIPLPIPSAGDKKEGDFLIDNRHKGHFEMKKREISLFF
jgi:hypothetical protein